MKCKKYVKIEKIRKYKAEDIYEVFSFEPLLEILNELHLLQNGKMFSYQLTKTKFDGEELRFIFIAKNKKIMNVIINELLSLYTGKYDMNFSCKKWEVII